MKMQNGDYVLTNGITEREYKKICDILVENTGANNPSWRFESALLFPAFGLCDKSEFIVHGKINSFVGRQLSFEQILGVAPVPHCDFSRTPNSGNSDSKEQPSVGSHLEVTFGNKSLWHECVVLPAKKIAIDRYAGWQVMAWQDDFEFRPLKTERERAIEGLLPIICSNSKGLLSASGATANDIAGAIYDEGFKKQ